MTYAIIENGAIVGTKFDKPESGEYVEYVESIGYPIKLVDGAVVAWTDEEIAADIEALEIKDGAATIRTKRDKFLAESDWVVTRAKELGQDVPREWFDYRSDLRGIPEQEGFPSSITWPDKPS
jgi:hypothetical protein